MTETYTKTKIFMFGFSYGMAFISLVLLILSRLEQYGIFFLPPMLGGYAAFWSIIYGFFYGLAALLWYRKIKKFRKVSLRYLFFIWGGVSVLALLFVCSPMGLWGIGPFITLVLPLFLLGGVCGMLANIFLKLRYYPAFIILFFLVFMICTVIGYSATKYDYDKVSEEMFRRLANEGRIEELIKYLENINFQVREDASNILIELDAETVIPVLKKHIISPKGSTHLKGKLLYILAKIYAKRHANEMKKEYLDLFYKSENKYAKAEILEKLNREVIHGDKEIVPIMIDIMKYEEDHIVLDKAVHLLRNKTDVKFEYISSGPFPTPEDIKANVKWWLDWWKKNKDNYRNS